MKTVLSLVFDNPLGRAAVAALGIVALVSAFMAQQRNIGAAKAFARIEKVNTHASNLGNRAAAGAIDSRVRGQRDPSTRVD